MLKYSFTNYMQVDRIPERLLVRILLCVLNIISIYTAAENQFNSQLIIFIKAKYINIFPLYFKFSCWLPNEL